MKRSDSGEVLFNLNDEGELVDALKSLFKETQVGKKFRAEYYDGDPDGKETQKLLDAVEMLFGTDGYASLNQLATALNTLILSGQVTPREQDDAEPLPEPKADTTPRDRNGKALTQEQLDWSEMTRFANESSMDAIRQRKNIDAKFRAFLATNYRREMVSTPVHDGVTNLNANRQAQQSGVPADVLAYATRYRTISSSDMRKELSPGMNPLGPAAAKEANRLFEAAVASGLI